MMRVWHGSDLHITDGHRLEDQRACLAAVVDAALETDPHLWLLTGDLYGRSVPHKPSPREREVLEPQLVRMAQQAPVVVLCGNHDEEVSIGRLRDLAGTWPIYTVTAAEVLEIPTAAGKAHVYALAYPTKRWLLASAEAKGLAPAQEQVEGRLDALLTIWRSRIERSRMKDPTSVHLLAAHLQVAGSLTSGGEVLAGNEIELSRASLAALGVDYGALGHIHKRQELAPRCWYSGSLWRNDHAETDPKGWNLVTIANGPHGVETRVDFHPSPCRRFVTLDWRWGSDRASGEPRWIERPSLPRFDSDLPDEAFVRDAEVRCRLVVPDSLALSVPWEDELRRVREAGAYRVVSERTIEPTVRARAPEIVSARTNEERLRRYWSSLTSPPEQVEQDEAVRLLALLESGERP